MRISTYQTFERPVQALQRNNQDLARTQEQISSGRRLASPADDPVAAARILKLNQESALRGVYQKNIDVVENSLGLSEAVLDQAASLLTRVRELTLQANNGINTKQDRQYIAKEIETRLTELTSLANTRTASGEYIFAGFKSGQAPFVVTRESVPEYRGNQGQREIQITNSTRVPVTDSGFDIFVNVNSAAPTFVTRAHPDNDAGSTASISTGLVLDAEAFAALYPDDAVIEFEPLGAVVPPAANFTVRRRSDNQVIEGLQNVRFDGQSDIRFAGIALSITGEVTPGDRFIVESTDKQSTFATLARLNEGLNKIGDGAGESDRLTSVVNDSLTNLDNAIESILQVRSDIGARLNTASSTRDLHQDVDLVSQQLLADLRDLDFTEAVSRLSFQSFILQAAQQSFVRTSNLSLFNVL